MCFFFPKYICLIRAKIAATLLQAALERHLWGFSICYIAATSLLHLLQNPSIFGGKCPQTASGRHLSRSKTLLQSLLQNCYKTATRSATSATKRAKKNGLDSRKMWLNGVIAWFFVFVVVCRRKIAEFDVITVTRKRSVGSKTFRFVFPVRAVE